MSTLKEVMIITIMLCWFISPALAARDRGDQVMPRDREPPTYNTSSTSVPEPSSLLLLAAGGGVLYLARRWYKK